MRVLVTGSSGTIGTRLCEELLRRGDEIAGIDWVKNKWLKEVDARTMRCDLRSTREISTLIIQGQFDAVVHLAANARVYELVEHPDRAADNYLTLFHALEIARAHGIPRFLFAGSREGYGNIATDNYTEDLVRVENCESPYTASKIGGEALVWAYGRCYGLRHIITRFSNVYGMYDDSVRVVPQFIRQARANQPLTIFGEKKCLDFTYIDDAVAGILLCLDRFDDVKNDTFNIATGTASTILRLAESIKELTGSKSVIDLRESRTGEVISYTANIAKAKEKLGYDPKVGFEEGVKKAVEWYKANT